MKVYVEKGATQVVLEREEELIDMLGKVAKDYNLPGAWLQSGLGGAMNVTLSFYDIHTRSYIDKRVSEPLEIISLTGNLAWIDGTPFWHVHGSFGTSSYTTLSGHVKEMTIALTGELLILPLETELTRSYDETTGLKLLDHA